MAWTRKQLGLALLLVITGSINTLSTKWADTMESINSEGELAEFNHPFFQADCMFIGEVSCMVVFYLMRCIRRYQDRRRGSELAPGQESVVKFPPLIFYIPAVCDMVATSTMYLGLTLTYASSFQMLRGAVIVFTGLLSTAFLGQKLRYFNWLGIAFVLTGLVTVGISDFLSDSTSDYTTNEIITGDLLIIAAQIVTATQMVVEQKFLTKYDVPPLLAVGWEGVFGFITLSILLIPFNYIPAGVFSGNPQGTLEDPVDALIQLSNNGLLVLAVLGNIISIAFFNFAGVSVTKELSATTRMVLDSIRTLVVWLFSLAIGWQPFQYLQPIGFIVLVIGMFVYNDVLIFPFMRERGWINDEVQPERLEEEDDEVRQSIDPLAASTLEGSTHSRSSSVNANDEKNSSQKSS